MTKHKLQSIIDLGNKMSEQELAELVDFAWAVGGELCHRVAFSGKKNVAEIDLTVPSTKPVEAVSFRRVA